MDDVWRVCNIKADGTGGYMGGDNEDVTGSAQRTDDGGPLCHLVLREEGGVIGPVPDVFPEPLAGVLGGEAACAREDRVL